MGCHSQVVREQERACSIETRRSLWTVIIGKGDDETTLLYQGPGLAEGLRYDTNCMYRVCTLQSTFHPAGHCGLLCNPVNPLPGLPRAPGSSLSNDNSLQSYGDCQTQRLGQRRVSCQSGSSNAQGKKAHAHGTPFQVKIPTRE